MQPLAWHKARIENILSSTTAEWNDYPETPIRYRLHKPGRSTSSLWLSIAVSTGTFTVSATGELSADMGRPIKKLVGRPTVTDGNHMEWRRVSFEDTCQIIEEFNRLFPAGTTAA